MPSKLFNHSKLKMEEAKRVTCPRCNGFGSCFHDGSNKCICRGKREVWRSDSGWIRPIGGIIGESEQLY